MYNNRNSYAEIFSPQELEAIHVTSNLEEVIKNLIRRKKLVLLTGNPGDGKTHLIRYIEPYLKKHNTFIELDINEVADHQAFVSELTEALNNERPALIAINEYPLYELLKSMGNTFPFHDQIEKIKSNSLIYEDECKIDYSSFRAAIIDLNNRNLLNSNTLNDAFNKLLTNVSLCEFCSSGEICVHNQNAKSLSNHEVQKRVIKLISLLGNIGSHAVMRDILGLIAFILTAGKKCSSLNADIIGYSYFNLLFNGNNTLFKGLSNLDPARISNPIIDEQLWNGNLKEGWLLEEIDKSPSEIEDSDEAMNLFISLKRKYFFEHVDGEKLFDSYPNELLSFLALVKDSNDDQTDIIQNLVLSINRYYNPKETENQKLFIWNSHSYEARNYPETIISNSSFPFHNMKIQVPKLPKFLRDMEYSPNHFLFRVEDYRTNENIDLVVDYDLYRMLMLIARGYPPQILPHNHKFTLNRFMSQLSATQSRLQTNEFTIRSLKNNTIRKIIIKDNKYLIKNR